MSNYTEKIKNLLALAQSPNEHEARAALLKARELMARHKISERELSETDLNVETNMTGITFSKRRDPWVYNLASVIAVNHCCREFRTQIKGKQTGEIGFIGFSEDVSMCTELFKYAVDCVRSATSRLRKQAVKMADNYGHGFTHGLSEAYKQQQAEEWALVLVVPKEVNEFCGDLKKRTVTTAIDTNMAAFQEGVKDGQRFHGQKRIRQEHGTNKRIERTIDGRYSA